MAKMFEQMLAGAIALSGLTMAGVAVHREFGGGAPTVGQRSGPPGVAPGKAPVSDWRRLAAVGTWIGDSTAPVTIVEFTDFECPFCKRFHQRFLQASDSLPGKVALLVIHWPLKQHRFAKPAAKAAECAQVVGRFAEMTAALFAKQDSLGLKSWASFAADAGVADTVAFARCAREPSLSEKFSRGVAVGDSLEVHSTPTVIIDGLRYTPPPYDSLTAILRAAVAGRR